MNWIDQGLYNAFLTNMPLSCVDVCIFCDKGVLLVKRNTEPLKGGWCMPGGRLFKGELLKDCAKRKCIEEVGLDCTIGPIVHTDETVFDTGPRNIPIHSINVCFFAIPSNYDVRLDTYSDDFKWVLKIDPDFHPYVRKCLEKCGLQ